MSLLIGSDLPVGAIVKSPVSISDPNWKRCDGSILPRALYPLLSSRIPAVGSFTPTIRTPAAPIPAPNYGSATIAASNGTVIVTAVDQTSTGVTTGTQGLQYSTTGGASWALATTPVGFLAVGLAWTGTHFVCTGFLYNSGGGGYIACALVSSDGIVWTQSAAIPGAASYALGSCVANSSGTVLAMAFPDGATFGGMMSHMFISTDNGGSYAAMTPQPFWCGGNLSYPCMVWTGTKFIIFGASTALGSGMQWSTTGASGTWSIVPLLPWGNASVVSACSDGAGNVLVTVGTNSDLPMGGVAYASRDNGNTWAPVQLPGWGFACSYSNGRWFIAMGDWSYTNVGAFAVSADMSCWSYVPLAYQYGQFGVGNSGSCVMVSALGNYCAINTFGVTTLTEDTTNMYLPVTSVSFSYSGINASQGSYAQSYYDWIKVS